MRFFGYTRSLRTALIAFLVVSPAVDCDEFSSVNVALKTSFLPAPYLLELLETAALENPSSYFPLLDRIADGAFEHSVTDQDVYNTFVDILQQDGHLQDPVSLSSFKLALSLHAAAPRIEAHYQYYQSAVEPAMMAAQDAACPVWVHLDGQQYCSPELERAQQPVDADNLKTGLPFDRALGPHDSAVVSTLYADITHPLFAQFHHTVSQTAREGKSAYRVRYRPSSQDSDESLYIGGYGVELVLKRTDYIVIDDRETTSSAEKNDQQSQETATTDLKPLTSAEVMKLGLNAADHIMSSDDSMTALLEITSNFPKYSALLAGRNVSEEFLTEHRHNRNSLLPAGYNVVWMNGLQLQSRDMNAFSLLDILRSERHLIERLKGIGLSPTQAVDLLSHEVLAGAQADDQPLRFLWRQPPGEESAIVWLNDIERDTRYARWSPDLTMLLQRTYPGQLPQVRRDIHNVVVPVDLNKIQDLDLIVNTLQMLIKRAYPIRIGILPVGNDSASQQAAKLSYYLLDTFGLNVLMKFYQGIVTSKKGIASIQSTFAAVVKDREPKDDKTTLVYQQIFDSEDFEKRMVILKNYETRLSLSGESPPVLVNGVAIPRTESWFEALSQRIYADHRTLQVAVYEGEISSDVYVPDYFLQGAASRRNALVVPESSKEINIVNVAEIVAEFASTFNHLITIPGDQSALLSSRAHLLLAVNLDDPLGQQLHSEAVAFREAHPEVEMVIVQSRKPIDVDGALASESYQKSGSSEFDRERLESLVGTNADNFPGGANMDQERTEQYWGLCGELLRAINLARGDNGIWLNGRVIGPITEEFSKDDFEMLLEYEIVERIAPVTTAITALGLEDKFSHPIDIAKVTSTIARSLKSDIPEGIYESAPLIRIDRFRNWLNQSTLIHAKSDIEPVIQIVASIDPASEVAQSWVPILKTLSELDGVDVKIYLNPKEQIEDLPVKRFYRNVISSAPSFHVNGSQITPRAEFSGIPRDVLFNLGMVVPPAWLVSPEESIYDLDNIKLSNVPTGQNIDALYELENILIEGHSRDVTKGPPPRGVQLLLGTETNPHATDTIIMANLGYFQFKANPGHWKITLKPGRSSKVFEIDSIGSKGYAAQPGDEGNLVTLMSFQGVTLFPRLSRKVGQEDEDVLETTGLADTAASYLKKGQSLLSSFGIGQKKAGSGTTQAEINIFSVASGHLYERMLNIMMLSVLKHTKHTVKFWFIEQFLSPSFKRSLPHLAAHYNFNYEMVTYKWPHWLRGQKEKQREIWGYKILFLDVLFPLDLDKVIFVDADQIVRTDMIELTRVDLEGAPYGFTPMCDSRTEMEGFRFWKQGYWANFLEGKPYHISALYVVDLKRFRELAAGDRLRGQYHALSADPNSLSNLDQDLPNHMQHNLPIHSLDQNWLWCETWCSDEALDTARTIDLCNNPLTKEPKLDRARRQVPEWTEYDNEIASVLKEAMHGEGEDEGDVDLTAGSERQNEELSGNGKGEGYKKDEL